MGGPGSGGPRFIRGGPSPNPGGRSRESRRAKHRIEAAVEKIMSEASAVDSNSTRLESGLRAVAKRFDVEEVDALALKCGQFLLEFWAGKPVASFELSEVPAHIAILDRLTAEERVSVAAYGPTALPAWAKEELGISEPGPEVGGAPLN
jgi:hypothetical protein